VTWNYINRPDKEVRNSTIQKKKDIVEEVYQRYRAMLFSFYFFLRQLCS